MNDQSHITQLEMTYAEGVQAHDLERIRHLMAASCQVSLASDRNGIQTYSAEAFLEGLRHLRIENLTVHDIGVNVHGETAISTVRWVQRGSWAGTRRDGEYFMSTVWARQAGQWKMISRQISRPEPDGQADWLVPEVQGGARQPLPGRTDSDDIMGSLDAFLAALNANDVSALDRILSPTFYYAFPGPGASRVTTSRHGFLDFVQQNFRMLHVELDDLDTRFYGSLSVVTCIWIMQGVWDGRLHSGRTYVTQIWTQRDHQWQLDSMQAARPERDSEPEPWPNQWSGG
jgi:ketosteroid isomerase-like protein